ncbi:MAG TPA: SDR family NAD(P)-dependent oxidoreductase, partial [Flavisolibacter sp.]
MSKTVLITGAASGVGKATAKYFSRKGWNVIATMRRPEEEKEMDGVDNIH